MATKPPISQDLDAATENQPQPTPTQLTVPQATGIAAFVFDPEAHAGSGFEGVVASRDIMIPRLAILQALSPQVTKGKPEFNPVARVGDICDTGSGDIFPAPLRVVVVSYRVQYLEWSPRTGGKGLVAIHSMDQDFRTRVDLGTGKRITKEGNTVVESAQFYCVLPDLGNRKVFIPMSSTQRKKAKRWVTRITGERALSVKTGREYQPPIFYRTWLLTSATETNTQGTWEGWGVEPGPKVEELPNGNDVASNVIEFAESLSKGLIAVQQEPVEAEVF